MHKQQCWGFLSSILAMMALVFAACSGPDMITTEQESGTGGMVSTDVQGKLFVGELEPPSIGYAAMFVHADNSVDFLAVDANDPAASRYMSGSLNGQRLSINDEFGKARGLGRPEGPGFAVNLAFPKGNVRTLMSESETGLLFVGEYSGKVAALLVLEDGSVHGIAVVEDGENPVLEHLCVETDITDTVDTVTAQTCDSGKDVLLTRVIE
ncbi:MAG: hypothetical protein JXB30_01880 [Anaerolineae bacterium]|nr:hypothetical protein [Anaerolineae bacterium]